MDFITEQVKQFEITVQKAREILYLDILSEEEEIIFDEKTDDIYQEVLEFIREKSGCADCRVSRHSRRTKQ